VENFRRKDAGFAQQGNIFRTEYHAQTLDGKQKLAVLAEILPPAAFVHTAAGNYTVQMGMKAQSLSPRMQHGNHSGG
jgi:hypothetical protein